MSESFAMRVVRANSRMLDQMARAPRWVDAPWAVLSVAGMVLGWFLESGPPYWWFGTSLLGTLVRFNVTATRLSKGTSSLNPVLDRWMDRREARRRLKP